MIGGDKNRKSPRLKYFNYSQHGSYFITICTKERQCCLGAVINFNMILSEIGKIAHQFWHEIPSHFPHTRLHALIVMPNHVHGIIEILESVGTRHGVSLQSVSLHGASLPTDHENIFGPQPRCSLSVIINQYKSSVKRWCNQNDFEYFQWQSRFYDHIVRNEDEYWRIRQYILDNPKNWCNDKFYESD